MGAVSNARAWHARVSENRLRYLQVVFFIYGALHAFLPAEPFYVPYMEDDVGLTSQQVVNEALPWFSYSHVIVLVILGIVTDRLVPYKVVILTTIVFGQCASRVFLMWGRSLAAMQWSEAAFAFGIAGEAIFHSYFFVLVEKKDFHAINSVSRAANYLGRFTSSIVGQVLKDYYGFPLRSLFYISFWTVLVSAITAICCFPNGRKPSCLRADPELGETGKAAKELRVVSTETLELASLREGASEPREAAAFVATQRTRPQRFKAYLRRLFPGALIPPLIMFLLALTHYIYVSVYSQSLWRALSKETELNGWVNAVSHLCIMIATLCSGPLRKHFSYFGLALPLATVICGLTFLQATAVYTHIAQAYIGYVGTMACTYALVSLSAAEMAMCASTGADDESRRAIPVATLFAFANLGVSSCQLLAQLILARKLKMPAIQRYWLYAVYSAIMLTVTAALFIHDRAKQQRKAAKVADIALAVDKAAMANMADA